MSGLVGSWQVGSDLFSDDGGDAFGSFAQVDGVPRLFRLTIEAN